MSQAVLDDTLFEFINRSAYSEKYLFLGMCAPPAAGPQFSINYMLRIHGVGSNYFIVIQQRYNPFRIPNFTYDIKFGQPISFRTHNIFETEYYQGE